MFKKISINLSGPICRCYEENLIWVIGHDEMHVRCNICNIKIVIPFKAADYIFTLDAPYPGLPKKTM